MKIGDGPQQNVLSLKTLGAPVPHTAKSPKLSQDITILTRIYDICGLHTCYIKSSAEKSLSLIGSLFNSFFLINIRHAVGKRTSL